MIPTVKGFSIVNEADLPICHVKCSVYPRFTSSCLHILCYEEPLYYLKTKVLMINLVPNVTPQTGVWKWKNFIILYVLEEGSMVAIEGVFWRSHQSTESAKQVWHWKGLSGSEQMSFYFLAGAGVRGCWVGHTSKGLVGCHRCICVSLGHHQGKAGRALVAGTNLITPVPWSPGWATHSLF